MATRPTPNVSQLRQSAHCAFDISSDSFVYRQGYEGAQRYMICSQTDEIIGFSDDDGSHPSELPAANINVTVRLHVAISISIEAYVFPAECI